MSKCIICPQGVKLRLSKEDFNQHIDSLRTLKLLSDEEFSRLKSCTESVLIECVNEDLFGYVAVAVNEETFDVAHVFYNVDRREMRGIDLNCLVSKQQKERKKVFLDALVINYMRIKVIEQLKIEGLTTRGQHHRKERFKSKDNLYA